MPCPEDMSDAQRPEAIPVCRMHGLCVRLRNNMIANNKFGTATQLGGFSRLRSYPQGRYKGAHTFFYETEVRWNLTDERTPNNLFIMKDVRTSVQIAAFYENGSTADLRSDLGRIWRDTYGFGLRVITASGVVFRGDMALGREGYEPEIFIGYPWEISCKRNYYIASLRGANRRSNPIFSEASLRPMKQENSKSKVISRKAAEDAEETLKISVLKPNALPFFASLALREKIGFCF